MVEYVAAAEFLRMRKSASRINDTSNMKKRILSLLSVLGLLAAPVTAEAQDATPGSIVYNGNMFTPGANAPEYKRVANERFGTQWYVDLVYGYWALDNAMDGYNENEHIAIMYAILNQRLIEDNVNGGTWLRIDVAGSWGLNNESDDPSTFYANAMGMCSGLHTDVLDAHDAALLEVSVKHFFAGRRGMIAAGMIKLNNYFDRVGHARFTNDNFESSGVLPLPYNNLAVVMQYELDSRNWVTAAVTRMGTRWGMNPFNPDHANGWAVVGEYGHIFADGQGRVRVSPFFCSQDGVGQDGALHDRNAVGIFGSVEYQVCDAAKVYARAGWASGDYQRCTAEFSAGATLRLCPSRPNDYLGIGYGMFKGADTGTSPLVNEFEKILELMYSVQINDYMYSSIYYHMIMDAAYRDKDFASAAGVQVGINF